MSKFKIKNKIIICLSLVTLIASAFVPVAFADDEDMPGMTGLQPMTEEELRIKEENLVLSEDAYINDLALDRINEKLRSENQSEIMLQTAELGEETVTDDNVSAFDAEGLQSVRIAPFLKKVDNTTDERTAKFFPVAGNQGGLGSCGAFSSTYYQMTYMNALAKGYDVRNDSSKILSPKFTYNIGRVDDNPGRGIWPSTAYAIAKKHGCPFNSEFTYVGSSSPATNYRAWPTEASVWESALRNKAKDSGYGYIGSSYDKTPVQSPDDENLDLIKTYLANGYVLNIATWINNWDTVNVPGLGSLCISVNGENLGFHAMTVVGYDDTVYYDINGDGMEDPGEFGAFKIINSWGSSRYETWFAYDAILDYTDLIDNNRLDYSDSAQRWFLSTGTSTAASINGFSIKDVPFNLTYSTSSALNSSNHNIWIDAALPVKITRNKVWELNFNYPLNAGTVSSQTVYVKDLDENLFPTNLAFDDPKTIMVSYNKLYASNKYYTLTVNGVKTLGGNSLGNAFTKRFLVE